MTWFGGDQACPCGGGPLASCCGPYLAGTARPATAEQLMRSRYTAHSRGDADHLWRTWHPRTRPDDVTLDPSTTWTGLEIRKVEAGGPDDDTGIVEFTAHLRTRQGPSTHVERSTFERRGGRWVYVDAEGSH